MPTALYPRGCPALRGPSRYPRRPRPRDRALDVRIEARDDGGYNLYVREKPEIASVLLTESTKDPAMKADNFAYRATEYNEVNGNEKRMLNGRALPSAGKLYSLISSTPLPDAAFGRAFRILIPPYSPMAIHGAVRGRWRWQGHLYKYSLLREALCRLRWRLQDNPYR